MDAILSSECTCTCDVKKYGMSGNPKCPCWEHCACFDDSVENTSEVSREVE